MSDQVKLRKKQRKTLAFRKGAGADAEQGRADEVKTGMDGRGADDAKEAQAQGTSSEAGTGVTAAAAAAAAKSKKRKTEAMSKEVHAEELTLDAGATSEAAPAETKTNKKKKTNKNKLADGDASEHVRSPPTKEKKRKRDEQAVESPASKPARGTKKRFDEAGKGTTVTQEDEDSKDKAEKNTEQRRFIVFVGNMSFKSTSDDLGKHFAARCGETPAVRLLTKPGDASKRANLSKSKLKSIARGKAADPSAPISKGCAFVEFTSHQALQKALQFHHTQFQGRSINVELTAGGGGSGKERKERIEKKNKDLEQERRKLHEKYVKGKKDDEGASAKEKSKGTAKGAQSISTAQPSDGKQAAQEQDASSVPEPQWGPRAGGLKKSATKIPKWAASGANAVRLSG